MCQIVRRMPECLDIQVAVGGQKPDSRAFRLVMLVSTSSEKNGRPSHSPLKGCAPYTDSF
jgi:hypothetical protein